MLDAYNGWDATLVPLNPADSSYLSFERIALPALVESGIGIQVMKSLGNGKLVPTITAKECLHYSLSLPTHCIAAGPWRSRRGPDTENWKREYPQQAWRAGFIFHDDV